MKILRMHASFGCLCGATLELQDGLNILALPNESGKSTWCAFLLAMFYGIDTSERARGNFLPAKTRYKPWSGAPMQGSIDLVWQDRAITIERTSTARAPMSIFRAYETASGAPIDELTGENCGRILLGVERSVYERSAFIRQNALAVQPDSALESRLQALVTTGEEGKSFRDAQALLTKEKNRLSRAHSGLSDQLTDELHAVQSQLRQLSGIAAEDYSLRLRSAELDASLSELSGQLEDAEAWSAGEKLRTLRSAQAAADEAERKVQELREASRSLPDEETLSSLQQQLLDLPQAPGEAPVLPVPPVAPDPLRSLSAEAARAQLEADLQDYDAPDRVMHAPRWMLFAAAGLLLAAIALLFVLLPAGLICGAAALILLLFSVKKKRQEAAAEHEAQLLRDKVRKAYGRMERAEVESDGRTYLAALNAYEAQRLAAEAETARYHESCSSYNTALAALLAAFSPYASEVHDVFSARSALQSLREQQWKIQQATIKATGARETALQLEKAYGDVKEPSHIPEGKPAQAPEELRRRIENLSQQRAALLSQLDQHRGQIRALGDPAALSSQESALTSRLEAVQQHADAVQLALETLSDANTEIQTRFSPALNDRASELMSQLTGKRYDRILLDEHFSASAHPTGDTVQRPLGYLSTGTADQLYLAVRLAIYELAIPEEAAAPLVLDDALTFFDDTRCLQALHLLQSLAASRQILLFTCQARENQLLQ